MNFIRENVAAIRYEVWSCYWFVRCKLAAASADTALAFLEYPRWRAARWLARRFVGLGRVLMPPVLRPLAEIASRG